MAMTLPKLGNIRLGVIWFTDIATAQAYKEKSD